MYCSKDLSPDYDKLISQSILKSINEAFCSEFHRKLKCVVKSAGGFEPFRNLHFAQPSNSKVVVTVFHQNLKSYIFSDGIKYR